MKIRNITIIISCIFLIGITVGVYAANPIINGIEVKSDVNPQIVNGRVMVPIKTVSEGLGAEVKWDGKKQEVQINSNEDIWMEPFDPWNGSGYNAVCVVSRFLALLQSEVSGAYEILYENYPNIFSKSVRESPEPWTKVWHLANPGVGSSTNRLTFKILDG